MQLLYFIVQASYINLIVIFIVVFTENLGFFSRGNNLVCMLVPSFVHLSLDGSMFRASYMRQEVAGSMPCCRVKHFPRI